MKKGDIYRTVLKPYTHESQKLNALLGKKVKIVMFDDDVYTGILERDKDHKGSYFVNGLQPISFRKSHIKKIEDISITHHIKLMSEYARAKLKGLKPFEIRLNDRNYKVGDLVKYTIPDDEILNKVFKDMTYRIVYITNYAQKDGYIVFTDRLLGE
jgi:hypothetical protein